MSNIRHYFDTENQYNNEGFVPHLEPSISSFERTSLNNDDGKTTNKFTLKDLKKEKINKFKENMLYYFSAPETLLNYKSCLDQETYYNFYKDFDSEQFLYQKESQKNLDSLYNKHNKISKLSNYKNSFYAMMSLMVTESDISKNNMNSCYLIKEKMGEITNLLFNGETESKLFLCLNELKEIFILHEINIKSLGLNLFNFIENNLVIILNLIISKFEQKNDIENLKKLLLIYLEILKIFKSSQLYFLIIKFFKKNKDIIKFELTNDIIQFIPNNCFNFNILYQNHKNILVKDLKGLIINKGIIEKNEKEFEFDFNKIWSLNFNNDLFIFVKESYKKKEKNTEIFENNNILYLKFNLSNKQLINSGKIIILENKEENKEKIKTLDINISIKNQIIYFFYIIENSVNNTKKYKLLYKLYRQSDMVLIKENEIELRKSFIPLKLFNDSKFLYCCSNKNEILMIKKNYDLDNENYINYSIRIYQQDLTFIKEIKNLNSFKMHNSLCISNFFFVDNAENNKKYIGKFINNKDDNYILNFYKINNNDDTNNYTNNNSKNKILNILYNNNRFIIIEIDKLSTDLYYDMTSENFNNLIDKGILLLPFTSNEYINNNSNNIYEYLLKEYSSFLNICGNFDIINAEKENNLLNFPFSLCLNFDQNNLDFIIKSIIENDNYDNIKLYYIIILKQVICSLFNGEILNEDKIKELIPYFKKLIINMIKEKEKKILNKILREIIYIISYLKDNTIIQVNDIKFALDNNYKDINIKTKTLLIELLLSQNNTLDLKELYKYIIQIEKNYLMNIFKNEIEEKNDNLYLSEGIISKSLISKASEMILKINKEIVYLIPFFAKSIIEICEYYKRLLDKKKYNNNYKNSFIANSFIFIYFNHIIDKLIVTKSIITEKETIFLLYKVLLLLDNLNLSNKLYDSMDMNNIIEISNFSSSIENNIINRQYNVNKKQEIKFKEPKNIIIKHNFRPIDKLKNIFNIELIKNNNEIVTIIPSIFYIYHDIVKINFEHKIENNSNNSNSNLFSINIISIKNEKEYFLFLTNMDFNQIILIQKNLIHYLLFLFEDVYTQIDEYYNDKIIKNHSKLFESEIFKFISIPKEEQIINDNQYDSQFINLTNQLIEKINEKFEDKNNGFNILKSNLVPSFMQINNEIYPKKYNYIENYEKYMKKLNTTIFHKNKNGSSIEEKKYTKLFYFFEYNLSKKKFILSQIKTNEKINSIILRIFLFSIKYYNVEDKLNNLIKEIDKFKNEEIKENITKINNIKNYSLFYSFYEESSKMKTIYHKEKNKFNISKFDEEMNKYLDNNIELIEYLYYNIIPSDDTNLEPNISIISNVLDLIEKKQIGVYDIEQYSIIQNIANQVKINEFLIFNNLLLYLNDESNIILLLNLFRKKIRKSNNKYITIFDNKNGGDYLMIEKVKYQFHLLLQILSYKYLNNKNYSIITKISLIESLIWKIHGRNFPILFEVMEVFEEIKSAKKIKDNSKQFYNINYLDESKYMDIKLEVFKILVYQIINKIKDIIKSINENNCNIILERNPSNISNKNYKDLLKIIISYFVDISPENLYYNDLILFFYKMLINSKTLLDFILATYPQVIAKIMKIVFDNDKISNKDNNDKNKNENTRLIMIKLFYNILENVHDDNLDNLSFYIQQFETNSLNIENPFVYLFEKISNELTKEKEIIIYKYFCKLLLLCANKIYEIDNTIDNIKNIINIDIKNIIALLLNDNYSYLFENKFLIKTKYTKTFEEEILFNSEDNKAIKTGKIICFLNYGIKPKYVDEEYDNEINDSIINDYLTDNSINYFDENVFTSNVKNANDKYKDVLVIMDDKEKCENYNISNIDIIPVSEISIIENDSSNQKLFIKKNIKLIIDLFKNIIEKDSLNEKGIYFLLKIFSKLINHLNKEDLLYFLKYFWNYYEKNKLEENTSIFMSLEFTEDLINKYNDCKNKSLEFHNIYKIKNDNQSLNYLFNYIINENNLGICLINDDDTKIKWYKECLTNPFIKNNNYNDNIKNIYNKCYKIDNLSFYKCHDIYTNELINDNSLLFTKFIKDVNNLSEISKIIEKNKNKIRAIVIINEIKDILQSDLINFVINNGIPIYVIKFHIYKIFIDFFIEGIGVNYIYLNQKDKIKNENKNNSNYILDIYKFNFNTINKDENLGKTKDEKEDSKKLEIFEKNRNRIYNDFINETKIIYNILNIKLIKRLIYEILSIDSIQIDEVEILFGNIKNIVYIFEVLCMEYYFNIQHDISNEFLKKKLNNYLLTMISKESDKDKNIENNKWLICYIDEYTKVNNKYNFTYKQYLLLYSLSKYNNENKLFADYLNSYNNILYNKLLFLLDAFFKLSNKEYYFIKYLNSLNRALENILLLIKNKNLNDIDLGNNKDDLEEKDNYEYLFLFEIINNLYKHYINNEFIEKNNEIFEKYFLSSNIHNSMKIMIEEYIDIDQYFSNNYNNYKNYGRGTTKKMTKKLALLIQSIFKYFDFCFIFFLKDIKRDLFEYWINKNNKIFKFYCHYKILSIENNYKESDLNEIMALIAFFTDAIEEYNKEDINENNKINNNFFEMKSNQFNEYKIEGKLFNYDLIFKNFSKNMKDYKIAIFCLDNNNKYILQDIINVNNIQKFNNIYNLRVNKNIYLVPIKNITTCLHRFDSDISKSRDNYFFNYYNDYSNKDFEFNNLSKIENIPKYSWNIGYGTDKNVLLISEENNQIYSSNFKEENSSSIKTDFIIEEKLNTKQNKIIDFLEGPEGSPSFLYTQKGEIFSLGKKNELKKYQWLNRKEINKMKYPLKININIDSKLKIASISCNYYEIYAIDINGNLYENKIQNIEYSNFYNIGNRKWTNIPLPENTRKFLQCSCGRDHLLFLIEDNKGRGIIYAKGHNTYFQCGINISTGVSNDIFGEDIDVIRKCDDIEDLDFKLISTNYFFSAAVTKSGELYIWGLKDSHNYNKAPIKSPKLVKNSNIIVDKIYLAYNKLFALGRILENGNYIKKLFSLEEVLSNSEKKSYILKEVKIFNINENNSRIIPLKVYITENKTYVLGVNENSLINEINDNKMNNKMDFKIEISLNPSRYNVEKLKKIYSSDNLKQFINLFFNLSDKNIETLVKVFDEIKGQRNFDEINYNELSLYLKDHNKMNNLFLFFKQNEKKEGKSLFNYFKSRIFLIEKNFLKYLYSVIESKTINFLQKIILNNNIYLPENTRINYFYSLLFNNYDLNSDNLNINDDGLNLNKIKINRHKAKNFYDKSNENSEKIIDIELNQTIFGQLFHIFENANARRFLLNNGKRLFSVDLEGENAIDVGGPYHEVISCMCNELQSDFIDLFIKTSNNKNNLGKLRDKYIVNPDLNKNIHKKAYEFIGKIMAMAISSGEVLSLDLHPIVWKSLLEKEITFEEYETIDYNFYNIIKQLEEALKNKDQILVESFDFNFMIKNSNESDVELIENGKEINVTLDNLENFLNLAKSKRANEMIAQIEYIKNGLYSAIKKNIIQILNWKQIEEMVCGKDKLDIKDLKNHTKYNGYKPKEIIIKWFWEWLENSNEENQFKYLKFVSGRTRLPKSIFGLNYRHNITKVSIENKFPRAATCFFTLKLPNYDSKEMLVEKMNYAIENSYEISDDH